VGLHGSQSRITRASPTPSRKVQVCALACWFDVSIWWVLITAFGVPVEPEVNRNLAIVSGVTAANAFATSGVSAVEATARNAVASSASLPLTIVAVWSGWIAASAAAKGFMAGT